MSNIASVPTFSVFASLCEPSATLTAAEFFTLRRQGANEEAFQSKSTIPSLDLSGLAPLRETSATQSQEDSFTRRRQGAKKAFQSKSPVSSLDLSGFASLREHSPIQGREEFLTRRRKAAKRRSQSKHQRFCRHAIGDALDSMLDHVVAEVDEEAESFIHQPQIGQNLFAVNRIER